MDDTIRDIFSRMWVAANFLTVSNRKKIVAFARAQHIPNPQEETSLARIVSYNMCTSTSSGLCSYPGHMYLHRFTSQFHEHITSPLWSSLVIDICRCVPIKSAEQTFERISSWHKEIRTMERRPRPSDFNYAVIFDRNRAHEPFHPSLKPNRSAALFVNDILVRWRSFACSTILYPRISSKTVSHGSTRAWCVLEGREWDNEINGIFSQHVMERYAYDTGHRLESPVEARQKWYRHGLTPRTYYAMGGTAYHRSKHLQGLFGELVNMLPPTNHDLRLNPTRIVLEDGEFLLIWDLTSFTSNHHEQPYFCDELAEFCIGFETTVMDHDEGFVKRDLGDMLYTYNTLNKQAEYSLERMDDYFLDLVRVHNVAGFLGVYGNLMSCTFVHGVSVLMLIDDPNKVNVAGDDGHAAVKEDNVDTLFEIIRGNGVVERSKLYRTDEDGSVCLKRGIVQFANRLLQKRMIIFPALGAILDLFENDRPNHFSPNLGLTMSDRRSSIAIEVLRFLKSTSSGVDLEPFEEQFILSYLSAIYTYASLPVEGSVPQCGGQYLCPVMPRQSSDLYEDPVRKVISQHYSGAVVVPRRMFDHDQETHSGSLRWYPGHVFVSPSHAYLSYMETVGCLSSEPLDTLCLGEEGFDRLLKEFQVSSPRIYTYSVISLPRSAGFVRDSDDEMSSYYSSLSGITVT